MVGFGLALLGSVGYELWGTGLSTARAQSHLRAELTRLGFPDRPIPRHADGYLRIPRLALAMAFVEGIEPEALAEGPAHYPNTPLPGVGGNVAIAGHRTTHLAPFWALNTLQAGDEISLQTRSGFFVYQVQWMRILGPNEWWVTDQTVTPSLTLTTCNPRFSSTGRIVVRAVEIYGRVPGGFVGADDPVMQWRRGGGPE